MPDIDERVRRYLRVAYAGSEDQGESRVPRAPRGRPTRWGIAASTAVRVALAVLVLGVAGVTFLVLAGRSEAPAAPVALPVATAMPTDAAAPSSSTTAEVVLVVHVAGAVVEPGVVELPAGTRVAEAIEAAGGATEAADLDALNLAAPVVDGEQVYVPEEGEVPPATGGAGASGAGGAAAGGGAGTPGALVNVNTADAAGLDTLPGIGPALAERIISYRTEHGRFASVDALTDVSGIGPATMERLRDLVTV